MQFEMRIRSDVPAATAWLRAFGVEGVCDPGPADLRITEHETAASDTGMRQFVFAPRTLKQALDLALALGREAGRFSEAMRVIAEGERRLAGLQRHLRPVIDERGSRRTAAVVICLSPVKLAAGWVCDLVELAGGRCEGPADVVFVALPGHDLSQAHEQVRGRGLWSRFGPESLWLVDGSRFLAYPGPSLYRAAELIAAGLYGQALPIRVAPDEMRRVGAEVGAA